ncbi:MAG TPA: hypothetical protein VE995_02820, partial [Gaiellaceae bacterium]|nr:hypothetical protein [Gaiellaceae bacterium]
MRGRLLGVAAAAALLWAPTGARAATGTTPTAPLADSHGRPVQTPVVPQRPDPQLTRRQALRDFERAPKVSAWLARYPRAGLSDEETYSAKAGEWTVKIWWGPAGEIAEGTVLDSTGRVVEAWTGPQVAWGMARGSPGAFGGATINDPWVWGAFCLVFFCGLADLRRPLSLRNLDLLFLLSP